MVIVPFRFSINSFARPSFSRNLFHIYFKILFLICYFFFDVYNQVQMLFIPNIVYLYILFQQIVNFIGVLKEPSFKNFLLYLSVLPPPPPCFQTHIHMYTCLCTNVDINVWIAHVPLKIVFGRSNLIFPWETN